MNSRLIKTIFMLTFVVLIGSLALNFILFKKAKDFYAREAKVRLEPISKRFENANQNLLTGEKSQPRLIIFGDSRCSMWAPFTPTNWGEVEFVNRGIPGETTAQILGRLESDVTPLQPDLVVLQMGSNDLKTVAVLPGTKEGTVEQTYDNIVTIAKTLSEQGIQVLVTTIFPPAPAELARKPLWSPEVNDSIDAVNDKLLEFNYPNVTVFDSDSILREGQYIKPTFSLDTLHLTADGYKALNEGLASIVKPLIAKDN